MERRGNGAQRGAGSAGATDHLVATASASGLRDVAPFWRGGIGGVFRDPPDF